MPVPITPRQFAQDMITAAENDPGCENKAMLFRLGDHEFIRFVRVRSESRCMVVEFGRDSKSEKVHKLVCSESDDAGKTL